MQLNSCLDWRIIKDGLKYHSGFFKRILAELFLKKRFKYALNFGVQIKDFFKKVQKQNIVLDIRYNRGGDCNIFKEFLWYTKQNEDSLKDFNSFFL